jgi:hypothetical protein
MTTLRLRRRDLDWREIDGEIVALDGLESLYLAANSSAALLWRALADGATPEALSARLMDVYSLDAAVAAADTARFLAELESAGLLESRSAAPAPA